MRSSCRWPGAAARPARHQACVYHGLGPAKCCLMGPSFFPCLPPLYPSMLMMRMIWKWWIVAKCAECGLQEEEGAKWPLLTLTRVRESLAALRQQPTTAQSAPMGSGGGAAADSEPAGPGPIARPPPGGASRSQARVPEPQPAEPGDKPAEGRSLGRGSAAGISASAASTEEGAYQRLSQLDPLRAGYYADSASGAAHVILRTPKAS